MSPAGKTDDADLLAQIRDDVFEDRVYGVSPKGDVVELPTGATPLDFAYHVHTQVGHRCRGAKVNGRIVPLTYLVQNGDKIEIITGSQPQPSRDWVNAKLGYLASARNRAKVRNWFRHLDRDQHQRHEKDDGKDGRLVALQPRQRVLAEAAAGGDFAGHGLLDDGLAQETEDHCVLTLGSSQA